MTIKILDDVVYIMLRKIDQASETAEPVHFNATDFTGRPLATKDFLGHLDYLNQTGYINADFTGNAYATQDDVPAILELREAQYRIPNPLGAEDGPFPHLIKFENAKLTEKGKAMLKDMEAKPPEAMETGPRTPIATKDMPFLEKVKLKGELPDLYDARDITEVVFRSMRDMMPKEMIKGIESELHEEGTESEKKPLQVDVANLWMDTNPLVRLLSLIRAPFKQGEGLLAVDDSQFLSRIKNEGGIPKTADHERVVKAVFSATKEELSNDNVEAIGQCLPGHVKELWQAA